MKDISDILMVITQRLKFLIVLSLSSAIFLATVIEPVNAEAKLSVINPGHDGYQEKWTAGKPRYVGFSLFEFYLHQLTFL